MATTLVASNLKVTLSESLTSNGQALNYINEVTFANIIPFDPRIMQIPTSGAITVMLFSTTVAAGQFIRDNVKYIRVTNKDDTNFIRLRVTKTSADTFDVKVNPGCSFLMSNLKESASSTGAAFSAFVDVDNISAQADTAAVYIEYFVASI